MASLTADEPTNMSNWWPDDGLQHPDHSSDESEDSQPHLDSLQPRAKQPRSSRACLACRRMKTKCETETQTSACKMCIKYHRQCVVSPPRQKRQKTSQRIADLEQKINLLTDALRQSHGKEVPPGTFPSSTGSDQSSLLPQPTTASEAYAESKVSSPSVLQDVVDKGVVDRQTAYLAFERYRTNMAPFFPFVVFPSNTNIDRIRHEKPLLFNAVVLAAVRGLRPELQDAIADDIRCAFADRIVLRAERSLELMQSILVFLCYHFRTFQKKHLNFNQLAHVASTMGLDLGLGRRARKGGLPRTWIPSDEMLDARRAWLGCYYLSVNLVISLRHPIFLRWSPYIEECLEVLSSDPQRQPTDVWLCDLTQLHRIAEDTALIFSMDDPGSSVSLKDAKTQYHLAALEQQLERWSKSATTDLTQPHVRYVHTGISLYVHEIGLHSEHNIDTFASPPAIDELSEALQNLEIAPARIDCMFTCLENIHSQLDALLQMDIDTLRCQHNIFFVRTGYTAMAFRTVADICDLTPSGKNQLRFIDLKYNEYTDAVIQRLAEAGKEQKSHIAASFSAVLNLIKSRRDEVSRRRTQSAAGLMSVHVHDHGALTQPQATATSSGGLTLPHASSTDSSPPQPGTYSTAPPLAPPLAPPPAPKLLPLPPSSSVDTTNSAAPRPSVPPAEQPFIDFDAFDTTMFDVGAFQHFDLDPTYGFYDLTAFDNSAL